MAAFIEKSRKVPPGRRTGFGAREAHHIETQRESLGADGFAVKASLSSAFICSPRA